MYEKKFEIELKENCNYVIQLSPSDDKVFFSLNEKGYIIPKEDFLSLNEKTLNNNKSKNIEFDDTIACARFSSDNNIIISDLTKAIEKCDFSQNIDSENNDEGNGEKKIAREGINLSNIRTIKFELDTGRGILVTGGFNIFLYDYINNKVINEIENKSKFLYSYCFLPNNKLATGNSIGGISIYNMDNCVKESKIEQHCLLVRNLALNKNKNILYSASDDLHINQIDLNTLNLNYPLVGHKEPITKMIYNENKNIMVTSSFDGTIKIWDIKGKNNCIETLESKNKNPIWDMSLSSDASLICYIGNENMGAFLLK